MRPILSSSVFIHGVRQQLPLEVPVPPEAPAAPPWAFIQEVEAAFVAPVEEPAPAVVEEAAEAAPVEADAPAEAEPAPVVGPTWSSSMTKSELLAVASQLGLTVSSSNTKAEILEALDASQQ